MTCQGYHFIPTLALKEPTYIIEREIKWNILPYTMYNKSAVEVFILSLIWTLSDTSTADGFLKTWQQKKKLFKTSNFSFCPHVFNSIQLLYFHLKGVSIFFGFVFKVVCCRFVVRGKGLNIKANIWTISPNDMIVQILIRGGNMKAKGEKALYVLFFLLPTCFNPFPHTSILQQTTLNVFVKK